MFSNQCYDSILDSLIPVPQMPLVMTLLTVVSKMSSIKSTDINTIRDPFAMGSMGETDGSNDIPPSPISASNPSLLHAQLLLHCQSSCLYLHLSLDFLLEVKEIFPTLNSQA